MGATSWRREENNVNAVDGGDFLKEVQFTMFRQTVHEGEIP